ncbi:Multidrug resistance protein MdtA [Legionella parisiensis]|uniref:Multidrug resistance protein MdtA n=2 Tax=Legionella parisiensis TaxID=45071 RepID=A0A1E5JNB5_9GAMM|nr:hypothetical protein [Legionella parisiensis]OEH46027.1 Multidrug resistance protein MdtA [Legionella parisiensis]
MTYIWIINSKSLKVHQRQIQIGELTPTGILVLKGLQQGEWIVTAGVHSLIEGEQVTLLKEQDN